MNKTHHETVVRKLIMLGAGLTLLLGLPLAFANRAFANPTPKFAYVANDQGGNVSAYTINSSTGALRAVAGSPFAAGVQPTSVTVDPSGQFAYVANAGRQRLGLRHQQLHGGLEGGLRLALRGRVCPFLGGGGPLGPVRLRD